MSKSFRIPFFPGLPEITLPAPSERVAIASELVTYENRRGQRIVGFHDFAKTAGRDHPWVIVLPGYGETKTDVLAAAYYLAKNGFHTLRFDYSDHLGESDGEIRTTSLTKFKDDILSSVDYLYRRHQPKAVGAVAGSLACRALFRAAVEDDRLGLLVNFVGIVDLQKTLRAIYREDHLGRALQGLPNGVMDVLGFQVDADHFLGSAIADRYADLATTLDDVARIRAPMVFFAAEKDAWVELKDVQEVFAAAASERKHLRVLQDGMHRLYENPQVAKLALKGAVEYALRYLPAKKHPGAVREPDLKEIGRRIRREKERNRLLHSVTRGEEREFWKSYLEKYAFIINVHDYWNLLDFMCRVLGEPGPEQRILDAGCGIGNYGSFLLMKALYRAGRELIPKSVVSLFSYVGLDFVEEAIAEARRTHEGLKKEFSQGAGPADYSYFIADLEGPLPFEARSFDQVCFNLVVSYLQEPGRAVAELARVLKRGGRIAITSLKPFADLSEVYRNFVAVAETDREVEEARRLLSNAGRVMAKEAEGIYRFFSEEELTDLLRAAGISEVETYRSFGNQANVAVGIKG